ncbi:MAG: 5-formyltetrahydrofolate cyclo-ligase [Pararhodobacter sp.]|nr:5-formyltetrahydrofolate cyclo-ligase [Pararhodobacter sp.]
MTSIDLAKAAARKTAYATRAAVHGQGRDGAAQAHLQSALIGFEAAPLSGYMPIRTEIDPLPVMAAHAGPVGVPVIVGMGQALDFRLWTPDCAMIAGPFGARIPAEGPRLVPQVLIVPLLAFDARGYRLGYGGGFYDRTLAVLRAAGPVLALGFAYGAQEVPVVPIDAYDQRLDGVVTEDGVRWFS